MEKDNVTYNESGNILDFLTGQELRDTPEERVRQSFMRVLCDDYNYPKELIRREVPIQSGSKILLDKDGSPIRADIVVYNNVNAALKQDQGNIRFVVECKKPNVNEGYAQLVSYIFNTSAAGGVWTNGEGLAIYRKLTEEQLYTFIGLRIRQLREEGATEDIDLVLPLQEYYRRHMADGTFVSWLAMDGERIVGTSRRGIARELLSRVVEEARAYGCGCVQITASDMGVLLYTDFGFVKNGNFMQYRL